MKCHLCDNEGTVYLTKFVNNKIQQFCYCHDCALKQGLLNTGALPDSSESNLNEEDETVHPLNAHALLACPNCGFSHEDWLLTKRLGCSCCYDVFSEDIKSHISSIQGFMSHEGKTPKMHSKKNSNLLKKRILQEHLAAAVEREDYELAAQLRDQITKL